MRLQGTDVEMVNINWIGLKMVPMCSPEWGEYGGTFQIVLAPRMSDLGKCGLFSRSIAESIYQVCD